MTQSEQLYFAVQDFQRTHPGTTSREARRWLLVRQAIQEAIDRKDFCLDTDGYFDKIWSDEDRKQMIEDRDLLQEAMRDLPILF